jgi:predicted MFS family arabinose efflux permease
VDEAATEARRALRLVRIASFCSTFDRMAIGPMLVAISRDLGVSLSRVTLAATAYFLLYGAMQPVWGLLSDRLGRIPVMRLTLTGAGIASALSAFSPSLALLVVARACAGALFAGVIPTALVYVGDTVPIERRQTALTELMSTTSAGIGVSTVVAGGAVAIADWRFVFGLSALAASVLAVALRGVPEPPRGAVPGALGALARLLRRPWPLAIILLALVEGTVVLGAITFLAPALEDSGIGPALAGFVVGLYGFATMGWTRVVRRTARTVAPAGLIAIGGTTIAAGYVIAALDPAITGIAVAAVVVACGFAFLHSTLQTWATEVAPDLRATAVSLFAAALFTGGAIGTAALGPLADAGSFSAVFLVAVAIAGPLGLCAALLRRRFGRRVAVPAP